MELIGHSFRIIAVTGVKFSTGLFIQVLFFSIYTEQRAIKIAVGEALTGSFTTADGERDRYVIHKVEHGWIDLNECDSRSYWGT